MGGWYWLDPSIALVIAAVVTFHAVRLILKAHGQLRSRPSDAVDRPQQ
jgi:divalent metal cation (Fe/Co/Zn/Cd) transporter